MIVAPQADRIDQNEPADRPRQGGGGLGGDEAAERMTDHGGRRKLERVEQLAVIDGEVEPAIERMDRLVIAAARPGKFRRVDRAGFGEARDEAAIGRQPPWTVQIEKRRTGARDLDLGRNAALPEFQRTHVHHDPCPQRNQDAAAMAGAAAGLRLPRRRCGHQRSS